MKLLSLLIILSFGSIASAQSRLAADNQKLNDLTRNFKTYSIELVINAAPVNTPVVNEIHTTLRNNFSFLKGKKMKRNASDLVIRVYMDGQVLGSERYTVTSNITNSATYTKHSYALDHLVHAWMTLHTNDAELITITLDSSAIVKRTYNYVETISDYSWASEYNAMRYKQSDRESADKGRMGVSQLWSFEKDFFQVFTNYKKSKL